MGHRIAIDETSTHSAPGYLESSVRADKQRVAELQAVIGALRSAGRDSREAERQLFVAVSNLGAAIARRLP